MRIIKRNGSEVEFDISKIENAIRKASAEVDAQHQLSEDDVEYIARQVTKVCEEHNRAMNVEEIQDIVESKLIQYNYADVARCYIKYRFTRELVRKGNSTDESILAIIDNTNEEVKQENSNKNPTVNSVQRDYMAGEVSKDLTRRILLPPDIVRAHDAGIIHFHDADYFSQRMHNCFTGATKFITDKGVREFKSFNDGDSVIVKDKDGILRRATVRMYGKQKMQVVTLKNPKKTVQFICTPNHRWVLKDGTVTTQLAVGDILYATQDSTQYTIETPEEAEAFTAGFVVGDGTDCSNDATRVRLCGDKKQYAPYFIMAGYTVTQPEQMDGDMVAYRYRKQKQDFLNGKAWRFMPATLQALAFHGYYAADGAKNAHKACTADERVALFIQETCGLAGYYLSSVVEEVRDTQFKSDSKLYAHHFAISHHDNWRWRVANIEPYSHGEVNAWCVEEPVTHTFTLEHGIVTGNCDLVNLEDMLQNGTVISGTLIEKPHSFSTACNIATQVIAQVASNQYGGQSITLTHLAPFVDISRQRIRKDVLKEVQEGVENGELNLVIGSEQCNRYVDRVTERRVRDEIKRGVQTIQYQVVTLMTTNGQAPFVTVFMYLNEAKDQRTKDDLAMIIEEVIKQRHQGVKNEKGVWITPAFPKIIYVLEEDNVYAGSKYYPLTRLAAQCTAKRLVPDYISEKKMKELKEGNCFPVMGCRSNLSVWRDENGNCKFYGRFNQGVVTINLVDVACSSEKNMDKFWRIFDERLELCYKALMCRHNRLKGTYSDAAPILWQHGAIARLAKGEKIDKLLYGGYSTISLGYAGLWECVKYMTGLDMTEPEGTELGLKIMKHMNAACDRWKAETSIGFGIYGTPLESTTYKFAKCLQKRFGIIPGVTDKNYITNSYHVHVTKEIDAFEKLRFEAQFQDLSTAGAISYIEVPNMQQNIDAVLEVLKFIYENIMYAELNTKSDYCQCCGYDGEILIVEENGKLLWECPNCKNRDQDKMSVARRTCGYIGSQFWNQGRTQEIKERVLHL